MVNSAYLYYNASYSTRILKTVFVIVKNKTKVIVCDEIDQLLRYQCDYCDVPRGLFSLLAIHTREKLYKYCLLSTLGIIIIE